MDVTFHKDVTKWQRITGKDGHKHEHTCLGVQAQVLPPRHSWSFGGDSIVAISHSRWMPSIYTETDRSVRLPSAAGRLAGCCSWLLHRDPSLR